MIPFSWLLLIWLGMLAVFGLVALITLFTHVRYGVANLTTYFSTFLFLGVTTIILFLTGMYLVQVDWSQGLDLGPTLSGIFNL